MFLDQDGDAAHEFYEQVKVGDRYVMKKCETNLQPQVNKAQKFSFFSLKVH